jgi:hypothetical protein
MRRRKRLANAVSDCNRQPNPLHQPNISQVVANESDFVPQTSLR